MTPYCKQQQHNCPTAPIPGTPPVMYSCITSKSAIGSHRALQHVSSSTQRLHTCTPHTPHTHAAEHPNTHPDPRNPATTAYQSTAQYTQLADIYTNILTHTPPPQVYNCAPPPPKGTPTAHKSPTLGAAASSLLPKNLPRCPQQEAKPCMRSPAATASWHSARLCCTCRCSQCGSALSSASLLPLRASARLAASRTALCAALQQ